MTLTFVSLLYNFTSAKGDYILTINRITPETVLQNSTVSFDVLLKLPDGTPDQNLSAFSLFMDIAPQVGKGLPSGLGTISVSNYLAGFTSTNGSNVDTGLVNVFQSANFDFSVNAERNTPDTIGALANKRLFQLDINTGSLQEGTFSLIFRDDPIGNGMSIRGDFPPFTGGNFGAPNISSVLSSSFTVTAVPEPSSIVLAGSVIATLCGVYRRNRKRLHHR